MTSDVEDSDVEDKDFTPLEYKLITSDRSWFINGRGGVGKTYLVILAQKYLTEIEDCSLVPSPTSDQYCIIINKW